MTSSGRTNPVRPLAPPATFSSPPHRHDIDGLADIARDQHQRFARDIEQEVVGPMPPKLFLETFLPYRTRVPTFKDVTFSRVPDKPESESAIYSPLVSWFNFYSLRFPHWPHRKTI